MPGDKSVNVNDTGVGIGPVYRSHSQPAPHPTSSTLSPDRRSNLEPTQSNHGTVAVEYLPCSTARVQYRSELRYCSSRRYRWSPPAKAERAEVTDETYRGSRRWFAVSTVGEKDVPEVLELLQRRFG